MVPALPTDLGKTLVPPASRAAEPGEAPDFKTIFASLAHMSGGLFRVSPTAQTDPERPESHAEINAETGGDAPDIELKDRKAPDEQRDKVTPEVKDVTATDDTADVVTPTNLAQTDKPEREEPGLRRDLAANADSREKSVLPRASNDALRDTWPTRDHVGAMSWPNEPQDADPTISVFATEMAPRPVTLQKAMPASAEVPEITREQVTRGEADTSAAARTIHAAEGSSRLPAISELAGGGGSTSRMQAQVPIAQDNHTVAEPGELALPRKVPQENAKAALINGRLTLAHIRVAQTATPVIWAQAAPQPQAFANSTTPVPGHVSDEATTAPRVAFVATPSAVSIAAFALGSADRATPLWHVAQEVSRVVPPPTMSPLIPVDETDAAPTAKPISDPIGRQIPADLAVNAQSGLRGEMASAALRADRRATVAHPLVSAQHANKLIAADPRPAMSTAAEPPGAFPRQGAAPPQLMPIFREQDLGTASSPTARTRTTVADFTYAPLAAPTPREEPTAKSAQPKAQAHHHDAATSTGRLLDASARPLTRSDFETPSVTSSTPLAPLPSHGHTIAVPIYAPSNGPQSETSGHGKGLETAQSIARQVAAQIPAAPGHGFEVVLAPDELGSVRLRLIGSDTGSLLIVHAERPETMDLMRRHIAVLEHDLRALGHDSLSVRFTGSGTGAGSGAGSGHPQNGPQHSAQSNSGDSGPETPHSAESPTQTPRAAAPADRIDLRL